jgi:SpoVK/Ycf46/Vps4 family AAA+-type ATPase
MADKLPEKQELKKPSVDPGKGGEVHEVPIEAKEHWRKGNALFEESKFDEAINEYNEAMKIDPKYADAYFNRALTERLTQNFSAAKKDLEYVMELQPKSADAPLLIGDIAESNNDFTGAKYWYERSLANNPDYAEAKNRLEQIDQKLHIDVGEEGAGSQKWDQKEMQKYDQKEAVIEEGQIKKVPFFKSTVTLETVKGQKKAKEFLQDNIILAIKRPDLFKKYGKKMGVGLLFYGPPGTGKTFLASAIAGESGANMIIAQINQIVDMYTGNTEKNLHAIFEQARKNTPCIIFFDELDALGTKRSGGGSEGGESNSIRLAINQFLTEMSGVEENPEGIYVVGATNQPWDIDPALKRSGRFGDTLYIKAPTYFERKAIFELYTKNAPRKKLNLGRLARATMGWSPADISRVADRAKMLPLLHEYSAKTERLLTTEDVLNVLRDKDYAGSSLDEWFEMVKKDVISKTETQIVDGKKQEIVKEGKLDPQEKIIYKALIKDIKRNTSSITIFVKKFMRWWALHIF